MPCLLVSNQGDIGVHRWCAACGLCYCVSCYVHGALRRVRPDNSKHDAQECGRFSGDVASSIANCIQCGCACRAFPHPGYAWTGGEEASIADCLELLQVPISKGLKTRLRIDGDSAIANQKAVRDALVEAWKACQRQCMGMLEWMFIKKKTNTHHDTSLIPDMLLKHCCTSFRLIEKSIELGAADRLLQCLVQDKDFIPSWRMCQSVGSPTIHEAFVLVLLRVMQALSKGEVVCDEALREQMVSLCMGVFQAATSMNAQTLIDFSHFNPKYDARGLKLSSISSKSPFSSAGTVLDTYLKKYELEKSSMIHDLVCSMLLVATTLEKQHTLAVQYMKFLQSEDTGFVLDRGAMHGIAQMEHSCKMFLDTVGPHLPA